MLSRSGETCSPRTSTSSPTFAIAVTSAGSAASASPRRKRAPPKPPDSTTIFCISRGHYRRMAEQEHLENAAIADRLEALAALLELADANPYAARAYRRAAAMIRDSKAPVADLVRAGRARELHGIGPSIEARLRELVETGEIAEIEALERELPPELIGLGRYLGWSTSRTLALARALDVRSASEFRAAAEAGRLRSAPGVGPKTEAKLLERLAGALPARPGRRLLLSRARFLVERVAAALEGEPAGDVRRWKDEPERLAVVVASEDATPALERFA